MLRSGEADCVHTGKDCNPMQLDLRAVDTLPKLAWVAAICRNQSRIEVLHGSWVETREDRFFEGAWDGSFQAGDFDDAVTFMGSGGRLDGGRVIFAGPTHKLDCIQSVLVGDTLYVSNSLVLLLTRAGEEIDPRHPNYYFDYLRHNRAGIRQVKPIRLRSGNQAYFHDCANLAVTRDLAVERMEKRINPPPSGYAEYEAFLDMTARQVPVNASDPMRKQIFRPLAAISRGYDSVAVAALASQAGCRRAITFRQSGWPEQEDGGGAIAHHLGMEVHECNRTDYARLPGFPEVEFYPDMSLAARELTLFEEQLNGSLFFNGQSGDAYWEKTGEAAAPLLQYPSARALYGPLLTDFRLRVGFIYFPLACCGAIHAPVITRLGRSPEMEAWSVGGDYDRPIPRRLAEERGVPRNLFGQKKVGGGPQIGEIDLCPASEAEFRKFYQDQIRNNSAVKQRRSRPHFRQWLYRISVFCARLPMGNWLMQRFRWMTGDRLHPNWGSMTLYTFHWGFFRIKERYKQSLQSYAADAAPR